jgi:hypothetical protein
MAKELIIIVIVRDGRKCGATPADRDQTSILLTLPECPATSATRIFSAPDGDAPLISTVPTSPENETRTRSISLAYVKLEGA